MAVADYRAAVSALPHVPAIELHALMAACRGSFEGEDVHDEADERGHGWLLGGVGKLNGFLVARQGCDHGLDENHTSARQPCEQLLLLSYS